MKLTAEQQHFYDHQTRAGTGYELTQRLNQLREGFYNGDRNTLLNRKAAVMAITDLQSRIDPQPTEQEQLVKHNDSVIETAQHYRNEGSDHIAQRVLEPRIRWGCLPSKGGCRPRQLQRMTDRYNL